MGPKADESPQCRSALRRDVGQRAGGAHSLSPGRWEATASSFWDFISQVSSFPPSALSKHFVPQPFMF